jgi:membrane-associated phospholipid phosphatase
MGSRALSRVVHAPPNGWLDVLRQVGIILAAYYAYRYTRGYVDGPQGAAIAFQNAREIIAFEQAIGLFFEPSLHELNRAIEPLNWFATMLYMNAQTTVVLGALVFLYVRHNESFYFVRNMFVVSFAIALVGYVVFPTAPPRFFGMEYGFIDSVSEFTGVEPDDKVNALFNPYAAVPSMHCAFAIMIAVPLARLSRFRVSRALWAVYPLVMCWCVVVTANHWWVDAALGAATAGASAYAAAWLARARPEVWAFAPARA